MQNLANYKMKVKLKFLVKLSEKESASRTMINVFDVSLMVQFRVHLIIHLELHLSVHSRIHIKVHKNLYPRLH